METRLNPKSIMGEGSQQRGGVAGPLGSSFLLVWVLLQPGLLSGPDQGSGGGGGWYQGGTQGSAGRCSSVCGESLTAASRVNSASGSSKVRVPLQTVRGPSPAASRLTGPSGQSRGRVASRGFLSAEWRDERPVSWAAGEPRGLLRHPAEPAVHGDPARSPVRPLAGASSYPMTSMCPVVSLPFITKWEEVYNKAVEFEVLPGTRRMPTHVT